MVRKARVGIMMPKEFNTGLWIFMMKAQFGWQEDQIPETEHLTIEFVG